MSSPSNLKLTMQSETSVEGSRQYTTKRPQLEVTSDLSVGELAAVLRWMMENAGIPSSTPVKIYREGVWFGKYYIETEHTTNEKIPTLDLGQVVP